MTKIHYFCYLAKVHHFCVIHNYTISIAMKFLAIIPSRYASTRLPGKPLVDILGQSMVQRVYNRCCQEFAHCYVATDDQRIVEHVEQFGGRAIMTSADHKSGTDRAMEALRKAEAITGEKFDVVVNIQGDEPFISPIQLRQIKGCFMGPDATQVDIATLIKPFSEDEEIENPNSPKVVVSTSGYALYFSRSVIPYLRSHQAQQWQSHHVYYKHIGLYAYRSAVLAQITALPQSSLELAESLEQLRWLENGYRIKTAITDIQGHAIDTPEDLALVIELAGSGKLL